MKRLEVKFYDSNFRHGWDGDDIDDLAVATAIGYCKSEDDKQLTLVMAYSDLGLNFAKLTIPKPAIIFIKEARLK
uniref:Uncharacterized protein n=1 Tax=viral metagenome TaxID=1070528 RepID=A0A6M3LTQ6_9ZZZZ